MNTTPNWTLPSYNRRSVLLASLAALPLEQYSRAMVVRPRSVKARVDKTLRSMPKADAAALVSLLASMSRGGR